ncbi:MAG: hypothetical protein K0S21_3761 [Rhizobiaceae bacterium]|nr:hypothetical protein [Rhizobiaceae bacterium]
MMWSGLVSLTSRAGVAVGQFDHPPDIQAHAVADHRQLVGEGDVDVAVGVLGQLDQFRRVGVGHQAGALDEDAVELVGAGGAGRGQAADDAVVFHQFQHHAAGQDAFRAIGDADVGAFAGRVGESQVGAKFGKLAGQAGGGSDRGCGFQHDQVAGFKHRGDRRCRGVDEAEVGALVLRQGGGHGDDEGFRRFRGHDGAQLAGHHGGADQHVEVRFAEMDLALRDHGNRVLVDIDADHFDAPAGERGRCRQADIAEAEDRDAGEFMLHGSTP